MCRFLTFIFLLIPAINSGYGGEFEDFRHIQSIKKMVNIGALNEEEAKAQIGQIRVSQDNDNPKIHGPIRGIASIESEQKVIELINDPIEIQVK